jgi:Endonuclease/Exonuclease/phosphatase family/Divergent InlB B-repeat domain
MISRLLFLMAVFLVPGVEETQMLNVHDGSGDGEYPAGTIVTVTAGPPTGEQFAGWTGDTSILANPFLATTSATIPTVDVSLTATYTATGAGTATAEAGIAENENSVDSGIPVSEASAVAQAPEAATARVNKKSKIKSQNVVRFATFNASLNRNAAGQLESDLSTLDNVQAQTVAEIIQRTRPDVLLINEFDFVKKGLAAQLFQENYLSVSQNGAEPIDYEYFFVAPSNTGIPSGFDLNNNGSVGGPDDAFGFGAFPGQFGMIVYSRYPISYDDIRTFQRFLWKDMPRALLPDDPSTPQPADWYSREELAVFRLSSKSHWDIPIQIGEKVVHFLVSHPTPPVFDGPEDRNGTRNFDEIRFWADYISGGRRARYIYDDQGENDGLERRSLFVIAGDQNSDPEDGDSAPGAIQQLLDHPLVNTRVTPASEGGPEAALQGGANETHQSDPKFDTADFADTAPGNLRADYVLPRKNMKIVDAAVFWPATRDPLSSLVTSSDHRLVWIDVRIPGTHSIYDRDDQDDEDEDGGNVREEDGLETGQ